MINSNGCCSVAHHNQSTLYSYTANLYMVFKHLKNSTWRFVIKVSIGDMMCLHLPLTGHKAVTLMYTLKIKYAQNSISKQNRLHLLSFVNLFFKAWYWQLCLRGERSPHLAGDRIHAKQHTHWSLSVYAAFALVNTGVHSLFHFSSFTSDSKL